MRIEDFNEPGLQIEDQVDVCIVGSGPAGLTIACELAHTKLSVLVVESGGLREEDALTSINEIESVGEPRIMEQPRVRNRVLGGTSHTWSGRCAPIDPIDYEARPWVPHSGWPISSTEVAPYIERATRYLGVGSPSYDMRLWSRHGEPDVDPALLRVCNWQYSRDPQRPSDYTRFARLAHAYEAPNVRVLLHATLAQILTHEGGKQLHAIEVTNLEGRRAVIRTRMLAVAAGGIENARLLLASNTTEPSGLGNQNDLVGRFLMDHPGCSAGIFNHSDERRIFARFGRHLLPPASGGHILVHGLALGFDLQRHRQLLNASAWLGGELAHDDPISAARRLLSGPRLPRDLYAVVSQPKILFRSLRDAAEKKREVSRKYGRVTLECTVEQLPNPESRVTLSGKLDTLRMPQVRVDWRIGAAERESIATLATLVAKELARIGLPTPRLADWILTGRHDEAEFTDIAHPMGTTRMSRDPRQGVVDENCQIHGVEGVYLAGSSIFPTAGHANPTHMIVALAIRLADHLKATSLLVLPEATTSKPEAT